MQVIVAGDSDSGYTQASLVGAMSAVAAVVATQVPAMAAAAPDDSALAAADPTEVLGDPVAAVGGVTLDGVQVAVAQVTHDVLLCVSALMR
jgi:hypothetical protein